MPARFSQVNHTTLSPSRRSPRVPANGKTNESTTPSIKASPTPPESSLNFRFYQPKTPSKSPLPPSRSRSASPDVPLNRRRTFQARPSRLSNVFTSVPETPNSSQSNRRTRRTATLDTTKHDPSDFDFPELLGTTGWTFDQYLGKFSSNDMGAKKPSTSSSSTETRSSSRVRKPTARAVEASETKQKLRKTKTSAPTPPKPSTAAASDPKGVVKKSKKNSRSNTASKVVLKKLDFAEDEAGQKLYDLAAVAMKVDFSLPADLEKIIADAREVFEQRQGGAAGAVDGNEAQTIGEPAQEEPAKEEPAQEDPRPRIILKFKKTAPPKLDLDGWTNAGRVNDNDEEIVLIPSDHSPYRSPYAYGDDGLPYPPVRARSEQQAESDDLGFPPLMGDRNIPAHKQSPFETEDVTEEKARVQARGQKRKQEAPAPPAYAVRAKKPRRNRRQPGDAVATPAITSPSDGTPPAAESEPIKLPVQRLKLKLKPAPEAAVERPPTNKPASQSQSGNAQRSVRGVGRGTGRGNARGTTRGGGRARPRGGVRGAAHGVERGGSSSSSRGSSSQGTTRGDAQAVPRGGSSSLSSGSSRGTNRGGTQGTRGGTGVIGRGASSNSSRGTASQGNTRGRGGSRGITKNRARGRGRGKSAK